MLTWLFSDEPNNDPSTTANSPSLLDGTTETSINLLTGVRISRPKDKEASEQLKPFLYQAFMIRPLGSSDGIPGFVPDEHAFLPDEPDTPDRGPDEKPDRPSKQWSSVRAAWDSPLLGATAAADTVTLWKGFGVNYMGWDAIKMAGRGTAGWHRAGESGESTGRAVHKGSVDQCRFVKQIPSC